MSKTKEKYMNAMMFACGQPEFHSREFARQFKISHNVITAMNELGLIQKVANGKYCWVIRREPLASDVLAIRKRLAAYNTTARQSNGQLKIAPLKRTERPHPAPQVESDVRPTEYPILDVAIAFLGGMVVAAFFTLIWK
jgi:hypothetical protein